MRSKFAQRERKRRRDQEAAAANKRSMPIVHGPIGLAPAEAPLALVAPALALEGGP